MGVFIPPEEFYKQLPKKPHSGAALFFDTDNRLLVVKPNYKSHWSIPGGMVDKDESPQEACVREVFEEINLTISNPRFLGVDYSFPFRDRKECVHYIFYGGEVSEEQKKILRPQPEEIDEIRFVPLEKAIELFMGNEERLTKRVLACLEALKNNRPVYMENGVVR
ncbi:MAG TPA: NUDIX hydrolase [Candidatus Paceibacterota bacterium]